MDPKTVEMMAKPRCGMPDKPQGSRRKWEKEMVTYRIINKTEDFTDYELKNAIEEKIKEWTRSINLLVTEAMSSNADINIHFSDINVPNQTVIGYAQNGDIFFHSEYQWTLSETSNEEALIFQWAAAHELGHVFGLEHTNDPTKIMNPTYVANIFGPTDVEKKILSHLYGNITLNKKLLCLDSPIDAMLSLPSLYLIIKSDFVWTFTLEGLERGPFPLSHLWGSGLAFLPNVTNMDAAFLIALPELTKTYFLKDNVFYKIQSNYFLAGRKTIRAGFPKIPDKVDAGFYYSKSVYFFKGEKFYIYDVSAKRVLVDGENIVKKFDGLPGDIEAATAVGGVAVFVKGDRLYRFDLKTAKIVGEEALRSDFFKC